MIKTILLLFILCLGIIIGIGIQYYYNNTFKFEDTINLIDLITLVVTVFLAIYIPSFLERQMQNRRYEKEVIIRKIESLQNTFSAINKLVTECVQKNSVSQANCYLIINSFTSISNELETTITLVEHCFKKDFKTELDSLNYMRREYKNIVTGEGFQSRGYQYSALTKKEEELMHIKIDKEICMLIFKINGK